MAEKSDEKRVPRSKKPFKRPYIKPWKVKDESAFQVKIPVCHGESLLLDRTDRLAIAVPRSTITEDMSAEAWVRAYMRMRNATVNYDRIFLEIVNYLEKGPEDFDKMDVVALVEALVEHAESAEIYDMEMWRRKLWQIKVCAGWEECYQIWYDYSD
ncbi:PREDICTED: uncharacterized protein LOC109470786 [Branchiostoma belcheri]|uniref:Uncharacterized protein LOC109470786 n=1 Tax=Branchiostoma belcheri TaxID=7741 RepID=A0A6P4Z727_BRABE|nr:PREDICTED: uncharacterized protein LOC109470786 [Branchiostoma belcheri]XP_019625422.1 PREDICTED: uncharacterized protein LOC109470786 [Branchiostoma belcheri]